MTGEDVATADGRGWYAAETATFGDRLAGAREAAGLSQSELARRLGVRSRTIAAWEQDLSEPRANRLQMVAGLLNVSLRWLLTGTGDGLEGPPDESSLSADLRGLLDELRQVRAEITVQSDRLGRIEKRLRGLAAEAAKDMP
jgi:transcriptional regulator with XRE-family HTH domain